MSVRSARKLIGIVDPGSAKGAMRETIHSGHFMVSDFEPESEAQDEEYEVGLALPPGPPETVVKGPDTPPCPGTSTALALTTQQSFYNQAVVKKENSLSFLEDDDSSAAAISIDGSLTKLFQCMTLAYRQKLTSPKWNRFKGVRLRWKDKIRLNNVIWRCWHMQFIMKKKTLVCQFASPLDVDGHNKPEAVVMEGKYWKRKLSTVAAEYKKWRLFYRNRIMGWSHATPSRDLHPVSLDGFDWNRSGTFGGTLGSNIIFDDDMFMDFTDTLFTSLACNQPFAFPNPREIARGGPVIADFIQPGLIQLQPNIDDFMDTLEPLQDYVNSKLLPSVPEEELESSFDQPETLLSEDVLSIPKLMSNSNSQTPSSQPPTTFYDSSSLLSSNSSSVVNTSRSALGSKVQIQSTTQDDGSGSLSKHQHHHPQQQDLFAKPQGKPRGRSRSGGRPSHHHHAHQGHIHNHGVQHSQHHPPHPPINQQLVNNANSTTLLTHLLTTGSNSAASTASSSGSGNDYGMPPLNAIMTGGESFQYPLPQQTPFHLSPSKNPLIVNFAGIASNANNGAGKPNSLLPQSNSSLNSGAGSSSSNGGNDGNSSPPLLGQQSPPMGPLSGPSSPSKCKFQGKGEGGGGGGGDRGQYKEHRRVCHINAEQKRRYNIKSGFDTLHSLIPQLSQNPNAKVSKAAMLAKGAEYIRQLKMERQQLKEEIERNRMQVEELNAAINNCQSMLPATGAPVSRQRASKMNEMFHSWVRMRTLENWKFWLFSTLIRPLLDSYNNSVSTSSIEEMCRTILAWVDQHCSLVDLRPAVLTSLRQLCTSTDILTNPANLQDEAYKAVNRPLQQQRGQNHHNEGSDR